MRYTYGHAIEKIFSYTSNSHTLLANYFGMLTFDSRFCSLFRTRLANHRPPWTMRSTLFVSCNEQFSSQFYNFRRIIRLGQGGTSHMTEPALQYSPAFTKIDVVKLRWQSLITVLNSRWALQLTTVCLEELFEMLYYYCQKQNRFRYLLLSLKRDILHLFRFQK